MKVLQVLGLLDKSMGDPSRSVLRTCEFVFKLGVEIELHTRYSKNKVKNNTSNNFKLKYCSITRVKERIFMPVANYYEKNIVNN